MSPTVWHLCSNRWNSAITEYALRSAQALSRMGWDSTLSGLPDSACATRAHELGIAGPTFRFKFFEIMRLRREAKRIKPQVIITYGGPETFLARFLSIPVVRFRGQDSDLARPLPAYSLKMGLGFCRAILTPAGVVADRFKTALPKMLVKSVTLGLDSSVFHARPRKAMERPRILIVGRLDPIKGHQKFFELFSETLKEWDTPRPKPFLEVIGQSSNISSATLRASARALGLAEGVDWGLIDARVPNLPERMANATLGVVPSLGSEVICRVAEEFLLSGTPVLVSDVGSLKECLIDDSFGGVMQNSRTDSALLKSWLFRSFDERQDMREERAAKADRYFSLEAMGQSLKEFLLPITNI